jgi:hypothetical protein
MRKRNVLANIKLSCKTDSKIICFIYDPKLDRLVLYKSHPEFTMADAIRTKNRLYKEASKRVLMYTNDDYSVLKDSDMRHFRYNNHRRDLLLAQDF